MSELGDHEADEPPAADAVVARLDGILDDFASAVADASTVSDAVRIDRIARLEKLRAATAALQAAESVRFAQSQVAEQMAANVHPDAIGRGIAEQIGLACRISPVTAARRLNTARALWFELPDTYSQLISGELPENIAETVVSEIRHLDAETRGHVDQQLKTAGIERMGFKAATACIRKAAYEADRDGYVQRGRTERRHRRVGIGTRHHGGIEQLSAGRARRRLLRRATATRRHRQSRRRWPDPGPDHGRHLGRAAHRTNRSR
jgi:hypothetical protein